MRHALILGLLACSASLQAEDRIRIGILLQTPPDMPPRLVEALIEETNRRWRFPGLELNWHRAGSEQTGVDNRLLIVHLIGECSLFRKEPSASAKPLGHTHVSDGQVLPFIDLDCATVAGAVSQRQRAGLLLRMESYARALSAVLTHEMVHALTGSRKHHASGVMQPQLTPAELCEQDIRMSASVIGDLEEALHVNLSEESHK